MEVLLLMLALATFIFWPTEVIKNTWHNTIILYRNTPRKDLNYGIDDSNYSIMGSYVSPGND